MIESIFILIVFMLLWGALHSFLASAYCKRLVQVN